jgi:hypothetical protein
MSWQFVGFVTPAAALALVGLLLALAGFRKLGPKAGAREAFDRWHAKHGKFLKLTGPLFLVGALVYFLITPFPVTWTRHTSADGACSIEFPDLPRHDTNTQDGDTTETLEVSLKDRNAHYSLSYSDLSAKDGARPVGDLFANLRDIYATTRTPASAPAQLVKEATISDHGFVGREYQFAVGDQFVSRIKVFISGRRVYRAIAVNPPDARLDRDAQRFIDSFRFEISKQ